MEIFKLFGSIMVDNDKANESIAKTDQKAEGLGKKFVNGVATVGKWGLALTGAAAAGAAGMFALVNKTAEAADFIDKLSERTGINREELQRWKYAAEQSGADIGKLETGVKKLSDVMDEASNGNEKATEAFTKLGISMDDLKNKSQEDIFEEVMASLADMEQGAERNALGNDLLGKSYTEMLPLLNAGSEGMDALKQRADELGIVMSEESVKANVVFGDTMADVKSALGAVGMNLANQVLPTFQTFLDWILAHMPQIKEFVGNAFTRISEVMDFVTTRILPPLFEGLSVLIGWIQQVIAFVKTWVSENQGQLKNMKAGFMDFFALVSETISAFIEFAKAYWAVFGDQIMKIAKFAFDMIVGIIKGAFSIVQGLLDFFIGLFTGDWSRMGEGLKKIWDGLWQAIAAVLKGAWNILSSQFQFLWGMISDWFGDLKDSAVQWGKNMLSGFVDGMMAKLEDVKKTASKVTSAVAGFLGFNSPAKEGEGRNIVKWGSNMIDGFLEGAESMIPDARKLMNNVVGSMKPEGTSTLSNSYGDIHVSIQASDLEELQGIQEFFQMLKMKTRQA
ncbi:phage tail protein [Sutcliffiella halmapala]